MVGTNLEREARKQLIRQLSAFYYLDDADVADIDASIAKALDRCAYCFTHIRNKYYQAGFDLLHNCQYSMFLYYLSNQVYHDEGVSRVADKIYGLLNITSSADLFYQVDLPDVLFFDHPRGAVMGRGTFSRFFQFSQGCTVGHNKGVYPSFGESVFLLPDAKVLGGCRIGSNVIISAGAYVKDTDIPDGSIVFGGPNDLVVKDGKEDYVCEYADSLFMRA